jgi:pimeloyl-ACP methyl ester carboxylesterase
VARSDILPPHLHVPERQVHFASTRGTNAVVTDWGVDEPLGTKPILFMCHATGLHGHAWVPLVLHLQRRFRCIAIDQRGQGDTTVPTTGTLSWDGIADDVEVALDTLGLLGRSDVYGIGHSQGGFAALEAERRRPGTFQGLFLYEPVVFPVPEDSVLAQLMSNGNHMAKLAEKRRPSFPSWEAAAANFVGKGPFAKADQDLINCYVHWGFNEHVDGTVHLKCPPRVEAEIFRHSLTDLYGSVSSIHCPTTVAVGEFTEPTFAERGPLMAALMPNGRSMRLDGRTHFGVFENIPEMATIVTKSLLGD